MSRQKDVVLWAALVLGGGYLIYRMFNQPQTGAPGTVPASTTVPPGSIQQSLDTALTNLATGVTGIVGG